jgi:hypothetical protein
MYTETTGFEQASTAGTSIVHQILLLILNMFTCRMDVIGQRWMMLDSGEYQHGHFGYGRVSTKDQTTENQRREIEGPPAMRSRTGTLMKACRARSRPPSAHSSPKC